MLTKMLLASAAAAAMLGSVAPSYADYVRSDGTVVRTQPRRVVVVAPSHHVYYQHDRGYHRGWAKHHNRVRYDRWGHRY